MSETPPEANPLMIVHDVDAEFATPQTGWYRIWYKRATMPDWCFDNVVAAIVPKRVQQFLDRQSVRFLTVERLMAGPRLPSYTQRERRYLERKGF